MSIFLLILNANLLLVIFVAIFLMELSSLIFLNIQLYTF